jgi:hypothetical protein
VIEILGSNEELRLHPIRFSSLVKSPIGIHQNGVLVGKIEPPLLAPATHVGSRRIGYFRIA